MRTLLTLVFVLFILPVFGQVSFSEEPKIRALMDRYESMGKEEGFVNGWRIKLVSTTNRRKLESTKYRFQQRYPGLFCYGPRCPPFPMPHP